MAKVEVVKNQQQNYNFGKTTTPIKNEGNDTKVSEMLASFNQQHNTNFLKDGEVADNTTLNGVSKADAKSKTSEAQTNYDTAQTNYNTAQTNYTKAEEALNAKKGQKDNNGNAVDCSAEETALKEAKTKMDEAKTKLDKAETNLNEAKTKEQETTDGLSSAQTEYKTQLQALNNEKNTQTGQNLDTGW